MINVLMSVEMSCMKMQIGTALSRRLQYNANIVQRTEREDTIDAVSHSV